MLTRNYRGEWRLDIFENFTADSTLPKFEHKATEDMESKSANGPQVTGRFANTGIAQSRIQFSSNDGIFVSDSVDMPTIANNTNEGWLSRAWQWLCSWFKRAPKKIEEPPKKPVEGVFTLVLEGCSTLSKFTARVATYKNMIEDARKMGQTALAEKLTKGFHQHCAEGVLIDAGHLRYIEEEKLIEFIKDCERGLRLDWVARFTRIIPPEIRSAKEPLDKLEVFDNYVVLHYDPDNKSNQWTEAEIQRRNEELAAKRKDPIMFGVMQNSRRLYFVGDWKDELCDLTFDQIADKLSAEETTLV